MGEDPTPRIGLVEATVVRATSVTKAPPRVAASSIFRTVLIKQPLRYPSRSPAEIKTGTRNSPTMSCGGRSSESTRGCWYHFETDALPTRPCPSCLSYFRIRVSGRVVARSRIAPVADLSFKETKLSLGLLGVNLPIQRRRRVLVKDVVLGYPDTPEKRPEGRGMITPDEVRGLVDHEVLEFSTEPRISVGYVELDDLSFLVTDAARRFEPVVPAKTHFFGTGPRRRPGQVRDDSRVQALQIRVPGSSRRHGPESRRRRRPTATLAVFALHHLDPVLVSDVPDPDTEVADRVLEVFDQFGWIESVFEVWGRGLR